MPTNRGTTQIGKFYRGTTQIQKIYRGTNLIYTASIGNDKGLYLRNTSVTGIKLGSAGYQPFTGKKDNTTETWSMVFNVVWLGGTGGRLFQYGNAGDRSSEIKITNDGYIQVHCKRSEIGVDRTFTSTSKLVTGFNQIGISYTGGIVINGVNRTPSGWSLDMRIYNDQIYLFQDNINAVCLAYCGWGSDLTNANLIAKTKIDYALESDASCAFRFNFDGNINYNRMIYSGDAAVVSLQGGTPVYYSYEWNDDRESEQI